MRYDGNEIVVEMKNEDGQWEEKRFVPKIGRVQTPKYRTILSNDQGTSLVCHAYPCTPGS